MGLVDGTDPEQRPGDRDLGLLGERDEVVPGLRVEHAVTGQDDRPPGPGDLGGGRLELARVSVHVRTEAGQPGDDFLGARMRGAGLLLERVLGDVDVDRARPAGARDVERLGHDARQVVRVADQVVVLGHRQGDAVDVDLLEGVLADQRGRDVAGDRDHRDRIEERGPDARDEVGGTRARGAHAHPHPTGDAGIAVGRVGAALLVPDEDVAELGVVAQDVVERQDHAARVAEEDVDTLEQERLAQDIGADAGALEVATLVEHLLAGALDRGGVGRAVIRDVAAARRCAGGPGRVGRISLGDGHLVGSSVSFVVGKRKTLAAPARVLRLIGGVRA